MRENIRNRMGIAAASLVLLFVPGAAAGENPAGEMLRAALAGPLAEVEHLVFAVRKPVRRHYYENFGYYLLPPGAYPYPSPGESAPGPAQHSGGGRLCLLNLRTGEVTVLLDDPPGAVRDPQVHYGGRKILFSYRKGGQPVPVRPARAGAGPGGRVPRLQPGHSAGVPEVRRGAAAPVAVQPHAAREVAPAASATIGGCRRAGPVRRRVRRQERRRLPGNPRGRGRRRRTAGALQAVRHARLSPSPYYLRQMQHYGILPDDLPPDAEIDPYAADRAYWRSLWRE